MWFVGLWLVDWLIGWVCVSDWFVGLRYGSKPTSSKGSETILILVSGVIGWKKTSFIDWRRQRLWQNRWEGGATYEEITSVCRHPNVEWPRYVERARRVRCWFGGQLLFSWAGFSFCIKTSVVREEYAGCRVSLWGDDSRSSTFLALSRYFSARRGNTRIPYSWNVPLVPDYNSILHCHEVSDKVLCSRNPK